jgi:chlorophyllide a reductase subunit Z
LADADVNILMYREFGVSLARELGKPAFYAPYGLEQTTAFLRDVGAALGLEQEAKAFIALEKRTTLAAWQDIWRSTHSDFFANAPISIVAPPSVKDGLEQYLGGELGLPIAYSAYRTGPQSAPSEAVREALRECSPSPMVVFGSINERMIIAQEKLPSRFIQCSFPGAVVRRATGTPHIGYGGAVWLLQLVCDVLFDTLFANLPTSYAPPQKATVPTADLLRDASDIVTAQGKGRNAVIEWTDDAKALSEQTVKRVPFFVRVSVTKKLRAEAEKLARERSGTVDRSIIEEVTAKYTPNR